MKNLKTEILEILKNHNLSEDSIFRVEFEDFSMPFKAFWNLAKDWYKDDCDSMKIFQGLTIVGDGFELSRSIIYTSIADISIVWEYKEKCKQFQPMGE